MDIPINSQVFFERILSDEVNDNYDPSLIDSFFLGKSEVRSFYGFRIRKNHGTPLVALWTTEKNANAVALLSVCDAVAPVIMDRGIDAARDLYLCKDNAARVIAGLWCARIKCAAINPPSGILNKYKITFDPTHTKEMLPYLLEHLRTVRKDITPELEQLVIDKVNENEFITPQELAPVFSEIGNKLGKYARNIIFEANKMDKDQIKTIVMEAWQKWELEPELTGCPRHTAFAKWFIENNPNYSADISSADIKHWLWQKTCEDDLQTAIAKMNNEIEPLIKPYLSTLLKKRRRMLIKDDYGFIDDKKWQDELNYFLDRAIFPHTMKIRVNVAAHVGLLHVANNPGYMIPEGESDKVAENEFWIVGNMIKIFINQTLDAMAEETFDKNIDVSKLDPTEYEHFCADLLEQSGWNVKVTQASGDQGIDILAEKDKFLLAIQCKKYSNPVGNKAVQEAHSGGTFYNANAFAVVSPVEYTPSARELASSLGVHLFHHDDLADLTIANKDKQ